MPACIFFPPQDAAWTKLETDHLVAMALKYDLRWPVIKDRYKCTPDRPVQELQQRFYDVANRLQVWPCRQTIGPSLAPKKRCLWVVLLMRCRCCTPTI